MDFINKCLGRDAVRGLFYYFTLPFTGKFINFADDMCFFDPDILRWIDLNKDNDPDRLRLKHAGDSRLAGAIDHIQALRKASRKLSSTLALAPRFAFPSTLAAEQSTSDALAAWHASLIEPGERVLDMTCGLGIDAFHLARRGAEVTACELQPRLAEAAVCNVRELGLANIRILNTDSVRYLEETDSTFDVMFIDPARRGDYGRRLFALADCAPDVTALLPLMFSKARTVIIKASPMLDISHTLSGLTGVDLIAATGTTRECKELLIRCRKDYQGPITVADVIADESHPDIEPFIFSYLPGQEAQAEPSYTDNPLPGQYLIEPWAPVMKSAPFRLLSARFSALKAAPNTHLYFSDGIIDYFPGSFHQILDVYDFDKRGIRELTRKYTELNITVRNFSLSADDLARRLKIKQGGSLRLFACTVGSPACGKSARRLIVTSPSCGPSRACPRAL